MRETIKNRTTRFLFATLVLILVVCVGIFLFLTVYMSRRSGATIKEVGTIYMSSMSEQVALHFETTMERYLSQVESLVTMSSHESYNDEQELRDSLAYSAKAQGFTHLAFFFPDGSFNMIYGDELEVVDPEPFLNSVNTGESKVAVGQNSKGEKIVLLGVSASYNVENCGTSTALVAAVPVSYISENLSLDEHNDSQYAFIIRRDGSFVIRSADAYRNSYFERARTLYEDVGGKDVEQFLTELQEAMDRGEDYFTEFQIYGEQRHLYCTKLSYSEWYLLTAMPYRSLDTIIENLGREWTAVTLLSCILILAMLLLVFAKYFQMTSRQIKELEQAQRAAEQARQEAEQASRSKSEFLSNMSHDIRTPMNAIVGLTAIATANIQNQQQVQNCLKKIALSGKHLLGLINDVLDMSKIESGKMTLNIDQVSLREVMESMVNIVQPQVKAKGQQFDVFIHDIAVENVCCDGVRLNQVMLNLLSNAVKFTPDGGTIQVAMDQEPSPRGEDYVRVHIRVKDNGIGMPKEFQEKIFESFSREDSARVHKTEGTGLGMAITKYIVDAMGGTIEVESEQGKGSEFRVTLDLEKADIQEMDMVLPSWDMLVVDDDRQLCESTVTALKDIGINAEWTLDGESALKLVEERHRRHSDYQIILLDWKLPGIDGIETARQIRRQMGEDIPILLISAYDWSDIEADARAAGIVGFISKPLFKSTLFYGLREFMGDIDTRAEGAADHQNEVDLAGKRVLLAEDNDLNWEIACELLSAQGLELEWAENGQICVDKFSRSQPGYYDAILMDLRMPVMNGYEATAAIRKMTDRPDVNIPIIAMTADAFSEDIQRCLDCGMNAHVAKPIDVREVSRLLERFISHQ